MHQRRAHHVRPPLSRNNREDIMQVRSILIVASAVAFVSSLPQTASGEGAVPNLAGTYRCEPAPGAMPIGTGLRGHQTGAHVEFKSDSGVVGQAASRATYRSVPFPLELARRHHVTR
jgi:hypothetical protein